MQVKVLRDTWLSHLNKMAKVGEIVEVPDGTKLHNNLEKVEGDKPESDKKK